MTSLVQKFLKTFKFVMISDVSDTFTCQICLEKLECPSLCPYCSKLFCEKCILDWLNKQKECPNCDRQLVSMNLVKIRWLDDIQKLWDGTEVDEDMCGQHTKKIISYCIECSTCVCQDCMSDLSKHDDHTFKSLEKIFQTDYFLIQNEIYSVKAILSEIGSIKNVIDSKISELQENIETIIENYKEEIVKIENQNDEFLNETLLKKKKTDSLFWCSKKKLSDIEVRMKNSSKIQLIKQKEEIVLDLNVMREEAMKHLETARVDETCVKAEKNLVIPFKIWTVVLNSMENLIKSGFVQFSNPLIDDYESIWKVVFKVKEQGSELHVALDLNGIGGLYESFIEIVHDNPEKCINFSKIVTNFDKSHPLAWRKLININELKREQFFSGSDGDCLTFRLYLRPSNIFEKCKIQEKYIEILQGGKPKVMKEESLKILPDDFARPKVPENIQICVVS